MPVFVNNSWHTGGFIDLIEVFSAEFPILLADVSISTGSISQVTSSLYADVNLIWESAAMIEAVSPGFAAMAGAFALGSQGMSSCIAEIS